MGIRNGSDAAKMARELNTFLQHPDMLFRRVRDEHGMLKLSKAMKDFHPGQGVYRSSYKNARRLAATETNMAYRTADHERWQQMDFIVGIEINLSNNHTCLGRDGKAHDFVDICDELAGRYPKDFKFTGWHPHCRCFATTIMKTDEELEDDEQRILNGEEPSNPADSENAVTDMPKQFKEWVLNNADRIAWGQASDRLPYFIRDNERYIDIQPMGLSAPAPISGKDIATLKKLGLIPKNDKTIGAILLSYDNPSSAQAGLERYITLPTAHSVFDYAKKYEDKSPRVKDLLNKIEAYRYKNEVYRARLINDLKDTCGELYREELIAAGKVDGLSFRKFQMNATCQEAIAYTTPDGQSHITKECVKDLIIFADKHGREYAYPIGTDGLFSLSEAAKETNSLPKLLNKGIKRIVFVDETNPQDEFWKYKYNNPDHVSMATDGGLVHFWLTPSSNEEFKGYLAHEAGHILDGLNNRYSSSKNWTNAVNADEASASKLVNFYKYNKYRVSKYAKNNESENFAECIKYFVMDEEWLRKNFPETNKYIGKMFNDYYKRRKTR